MTIDLHLGLSEYHASPRVSNSKLSDFLNKGPAYYEARHVSRTLPGESSDAFVLGQATDDAVFDPEGFRQRYVVRPDGIDLRTTAGRAWRDSVGDRVVLKAEDMARIEAMLRALRENSVARQLLEGGAAQVSAWCDAQGLPGIQTRPDYCHLEGHRLSDWRPAVCDLKTTSDFNGFGRSVANYGYARQQAMARIILGAEGIHDTCHLLVVVEKSAPFRCQVIELSAEYLGIGEREVRAGLARLAEHYASGQWPRVDEERVVLEPPTWMKAQAMLDPLARMVAA